MDGTPQRDPVAVATSLVTGFYRMLDERDYDGLAAAMHPGGAWHRQGSVLDTPETLLAAMRERSDSVRIHHLLTNVMGTLMDDGSVDVTAYMSVVKHDDGTPIEGAAPFAGILNIRTIRATAIETPQGWRLRHVGGDPPSFAAAEPTTNTPANARVQ